MRLRFPEKKFKDGLADDYLSLTIQRNQCRIRTLSRGLFSTNIFQKCKQEFLWRSSYTRIVGLRHKTACSVFQHHNSLFSRRK